MCEFAEDPFNNQRHLLTSRTEKLVLTQCSFCVTQYFISARNLNAVSLFTTILYGVCKGVSFFLASVTPIQWAFHVFKSTFNLNWSYELPVYEITLDPTKKYNDKTGQNSVAPRRHHKDRLQAQFSLTSVRNLMNYLAVFATLSVQNIFVLFYILISSIWPRDLGFINNKNNEPGESEALQLAVTHSNTKSNVSITLTIFNTSSSVNLFDQGKMFR